MATRTLKAKYETLDGSISGTRAILCHSKNVKEIYYQYEDEVEAPPAESASVAAAAAPAAPVAVAAPTGPLASIKDVPVKAIDILLVVVAQKLKKRIEEIPLSKTIKDLVGGKSTLQNEILGDLQQEFASAPEKGEEFPLEELGSTLGSGFNGSLGKYSTGLVSRLVGGKMPGGFNASSIKVYLAKAWGLGPSRSDGVLLLATTLKPPKRLASEAEAKAWLDSVVSVYAQRSGISLASPGAAGGGGGGGSGAVINSEEFLKFQADQEKFAAQHVEPYMRYLGRGSRAGELAFDQEKANSIALQAKLDSITREHGDAYIEGIQPRFDVFKARHFDSSWNWVHQDALLMWYDIIFGRLTTVDREITARCIALLNRADPDMLEYMQCNIDRCDPSKGETFKLAKEFGQQLINNTRERSLESPQCIKMVIFFSSYFTLVLTSGS
jgi:fatty acid synthase subunit beta